MLFGGPYLFYCALRFIHPAQDVNGAGLGAFFVNVLPAPFDFL
jgi:hypothetical protein